MGGKESQQAEQNSLRNDQCLRCRKSQRSPRVRASLFIRTTLTAMIGWMTGSGERRVMYYVIHTLFQSVRIHSYDITIHIYIIQVTTSRVLAVRLETDCESNSKE
jgi:hypothetical protein